MHFALIDKITRQLIFYNIISILTRTKTFIRYAKENDREKRERREREREWKRERVREWVSERERERERKRWKARRVTPTLRLMLSPNYGTRACKKGRGKRTVPSLRGKSSGIISGNYQWELSLRIMT